MQPVGGAKYFRGRQPEQLVYLETGHNRSSATKREIDLKKMNREEKSQLITSDTNKIREVVSGILHRAPKVVDTF
jgi:putative endonuclease